MQRTVVEVERVIEDGIPTLYLKLDCGHMDAIKDFDQRPPRVCNCTVCDGAGVPRRENAGMV